MTFVMGLFVICHLYATSPAQVNYSIISTFLPDPSADVRKKVKPYISSGQSQSRAILDCRLSRT